MALKKQSKKQLKKIEKIEEEKRFKKFTIYGIIFSIVFLFLFYAFVVNWCETRLLFRSYSLYGKQIAAECTCLAENKLKQHNTLMLKCSSNFFYVCGERCAHQIEKHYLKNAYVKDAFSGDSILKSNAIIGLKEIGKPDIVYFESKTTFNRYYAKE